MKGRETSWVEEDIILGMIQEGMLLYCETIRKMKKTYIYLLPLQTRNIVVGTTTTITPTISVGIIKPLPIPRQARKDTQIHLTLPA